MLTNPASRPRLLIVGCGYVGSQVASLATAAGMEVTALTRSPIRFAELEAMHVQPWRGSWLEPSTLQGLPEVDYVLIAIPHRADGQLAEQTHARGLAHLLAHLPKGWSKVLYLSTTGVYGQDSGQLVNEETLVSPNRIGPQMAVAAERWLWEQPYNSRVTVLRLAGIYGPGRIPLAEKWKHGQPLAVPRDGYLNLIHVADIARVIMQVLPRRMRHLLYLLSDGQPVLRDEFYRYLAELYGLNDPVFVPPDAESNKVRRATDKRVDPSRLVTELNFEYQFPNYRSGLVASCIKKE